MKYSTFIILVFVVAFWSFLSKHDSLAQAPVISYQNAYTFNRGVSISVISPTNTGGTIPATQYGTTTTLAGSVQGFADGTGVNAQFSKPLGIAVDNSGNVYVPDRYNNRIRKITPSGVVTTIAGNSTSGFVNGTGTAASFNQPDGVAIDASGNLYITDTGNYSVRKITPLGVVSTLAGAGTSGYVNGSGNVAKFNVPLGITVDLNNNVYVADRYNYRIRKISPLGEVSTYAGSGDTTGINAQGEYASFNEPVGIDINKDGIVYVGDYSNNLVRQIGTQGYVTTLAGCFCGGIDDEEGIMAGFKNPFGVAVGNGGDVFVADYNSNRIRRITPDGNVSTLSGSGVAGNTDGVRDLATFRSPADVAVDNAGNVYVADAGNSLIRKIVATGYSITPNLPNGLVFNSATGQISGTPSELLNPTIFTVTAYNKDGSSKTELTLSVKGLTSIFQTEEVSKFNLYPNPIVGKKLFAEIPTNIGDFKEVVIRDISGKTIYKQTYRVIGNLIEINFDYSHYDILFVEIVGLGSQKLIIN